MRNIQSFRHQATAKLTDLPHHQAGIPRATDGEKVWQAVCRSCLDEQVDPDGRGLCWFGSRPAQRHVALGIVGTGWEAIESMS